MLLQLITPPDRLCLPGVFHQLTGVAWRGRLNRWATPKMAPSSFEPADMRFPGFLWFEQCYTFAKTSVPSDIKTIASMLCIKYELTGLSHPLQVANMAGYALARGTGDGHFFRRAPGARAVSVPEASKTLTELLTPLLTVEDRATARGAVQDILQRIVGFVSLYDRIPQNKGVFRLM